MSMEAAHNLSGADPAGTVLPPLVRKLSHCVPFREKCLTLNTSDPPEKILDPSLLTLPRGPF